MGKKEKKSTNPHEPVAPAEAEPKSRTLIQPAEIGAGLDVNPIAMGGIEYVKGYKPKSAPAQYRRTFLCRAAPYHRH